MNAYAGARKALTPDRLSRFAIDCFETCSLHRQRFERSGLSAAMLTDTEAFAAIPLLTSAEVTAVGPAALLPDALAAAIADGSVREFSPEQRVARVSQTSTTTGGAPKLSVYTQSDWDTYRDTLPDIMAAFSSADYTRIFNCFAPTHGAGRFIDDAFPRLGSVVLNRHHAAAGPEEVVQQMAGSLKDFGGFTCLAAPPWSPGKTSKGSAIADLLDQDLDNLIGRTVRMVITAGAAASGSFNLRTRLDEATNLARRSPIEICEWYGSAEVGIAAASCECGHLHFVEGCVHGEVVAPETGAAVADGERGVIVLTALRAGSRYLRLVVGDEATVSLGVCDCGRQTPRLSEIKRFEDLFRLKRGCAATETSA